MQERWLFDTPGGLTERVDGRLWRLMENVATRCYGIEEQRTDKPHALYGRDRDTMTPQGAMLARPATLARRGEEKSAVQSLLLRRIPLIKTVTGFDEGSNVMWRDRESCLLGTSSRTNAAGADQVNEALRHMGVKDVSG